MIYFYAGRPREVQVRVDFPSGLLTEFYPQVRTLAPPYVSMLAEPRLLGPPATSTPQTRPAATTQPADSFIDWGRVRIIPNPLANRNRPFPP